MSNPQEEQHLYRRQDDQLGNVSSLDQSPSSPQLTLNCSSAQTLLIFLGPAVVPALIHLHRRIRSGPSIQVKPKSESPVWALSALFVSALVALVSTLPPFQPENIFFLTKSRLQTPASVLLSRLSAIRPLTPTDETLRRVFDAGGLESQLLYLRFGPSMFSCPLYPNPSVAFVPAEMCILCAAPSILAPHLLHLLALGIATSHFAGQHAPRWRTIACVAGFVLAAMEFSLLVYDDDSANLSSTRVTELDPTHWKFRVWRGLAIAATDAVLGWLMWLQATGRAWVVETEMGERVAEAASALEEIVKRAKTLAVLRNGVAREAGLRRRVESYWSREGEMMASILGDPEAVDAQRMAWKRLDVDKVRKEAEAYVDGGLAEFVD